MSDIWSFGLVMAELATGEYLFGKMKHNFVELFQYLKTNEKFFMDEESDCSPEFRDFVNSALVKEAKERPSTIELLSHPWILKNLDLLPTTNDWIVYLKSN